MAEAVLDIDKKYIDKPNVKRLEIEYKDMNYIIINIEEKVIDINGELYEVSISSEECTTLNKMIWEYETIDEYDFWPDKTKDHEPMGPMWRISWIDEFDTYYHKSGATKYPDNFEKLIKILKELKKI